MEFVIAVQSTAILFARIDLFALKPYCILEFFDNIESV